jgi:EAL domain-containing protein (putative c-di-GMP-specific phosphodiesterase class I)/GGDEF domain-containing protein
MDRAQEIRDALGKERADQLLAYLAQRLQEALDLPVIARYTTQASLGHLGDAEFALVLPRLAEPQHGVLVADTVRTHLGGRWELGEVELSPTFTAGVTTTSQRGMRAADLVPRAAAAAHAGSRRGGNLVQSSDPEAVHRATDRLRDEADLRHGIQHGELEVYYQPVIALSGCVTGTEALVRWQHPVKGLRSPVDFIPLAEETGLVVPLGWEVLRIACEQAASWRTELPGGSHLVVNVNMSPQQLEQGDTTERVEAVLRDTGLAPRGLVLEITEASTVHGGAVEQLSRVRSLGVGIAIDDFGTGYSSLLQLRKLPADVLKIDREFVAGLLTNPDDATIVSMSVRLAQALGLRVVAEGVETSEQAEELWRLGCEYGQGFLWSRPRPAAEFAQWWSGGRVPAGAGAHDRLT